MTLAFSPASCTSCSGASRFPMASTSSSFVLDTLGVSFRGVGSLACSKFSPVPGPCRRSREDVVICLEYIRAA